MKPWRITRMLCVIAAGAIGLLAQGGTRAVAAYAEAPNDGNGVEVLTRGPVHEAFAEPNSYNPAQGAVVLQEVPAAIEEIPPDEKPAGDALWIPGYWQWDVERSDFIWISGIWRVPPPGCSWVPGYWTAVAEGRTWTSGFWMASQVEEVTYLPQPPRSLEVGPSSPAPAPDYLWAPGCWFWTAGHYAWRPGYWVQARPNWVWSPSYYVNSPRGSIYIDGFWDWSIGLRGVLFAPAYIRRSIWERPNYVFSPSIVIQSDLLMAHLFINPSYGHYYFGDYYGAQYSRGGIYPWFDYHNRNRGYDPIYAHERWSRSRTDSHWEEHQRENYDYRMGHAEARPSRIYSAQAEFAARAPENQRQSMLIAAPLSEVAKRSDAPIRYEKISQDRRKSLGGQGKDLAKYRDQRAQWESSGKPALKGKSAPAAELSRKPGEAQTGRSAPEAVRIQSSRGPKESGKGQPERVVKRPGEVKTATPSVKTAQPKGREKTSKAPQIAEPRMQKIPRSPIAGKSADGSGQKDKPPSRPDVPKPDPNYRPKAVEKTKSAPEASRSSGPSDRKEQGKEDKSKGKRK